MSTHRGFLCAAGIVAIVLMLAPAAVRAQIVSATVAAPDGADWRDLAVYRPGGKLFVLDYTTSAILVFESTTLASAGQITLGSYAPDKPQSLAVDETTGKLYVTLGLGQATSATRAVVVDANTLAIGTTLTGLGWDAGITVDETRGRLYAVSVSEGMLRAFDAITYASLGSLDLDALMPNGLMSYGAEHFNPATGELLFTNIHYDTFLVVNGPALTGQLFSVASSRGWTGTWAPAENKIFITRVAWNGYFIYDRDTQASAVTSCINDGTQLFYSAPTNRVYSGAEINGDTTVIEAGSNGCQNVAVGVGKADVAFLPSKGMAFFTGSSSVTALTESNLQQTTVSTCLGGYGAVGNQIIADDVAQRVYVASTWSSPSQDSCLVALAVPALNVGDGTTVEGAGGTKTVSFPVTLSPAVGTTITVHYASANVSATAGTDYQAVSGTLTFLAGETTKSIDVTVNGDSSCEGDETFTLTLDSPTAGVALSDSQATGLILDDDGSAAPTGVLATASSATSVGVTWSPVAGAANYDVFRNLVKVGSSAGTAFTDSGAAAGAAYLYSVRAVNGAGCPSTLSASDLATTVIFTDAAITTTSTTVKAAHITELRTAVAAARSLAGLGAFSYTDPALAAGTTVRAAHVNDLRNAIAAARSALGLTAATWAETPTAGTTIKASHVDELRAAVR